MLKQLFSAAALVALAGSPALAAEVTEATPVNAAPEKVWATIGGFCGIGTWHPAVEACALSTQGGKNIRTLSLKGGGTIVEEEVGRDDARMAYSYRILESPLPVANYVSTIQVEPSGSAGSTPASHPGPPASRRAGGSSRSRTARVQPRTRAGTFLRGSSVPRNAT